MLAAPTVASPRLGAAVRLHSRRPVAASPTAHPDGRDWAGELDEATARRTARSRAAAAGAGRRRCRGLARWGPYVAERAWGSVREDYSADGEAWASFPFDHAVSRTYRWNEDGLCRLVGRRSNGSASGWRCGTASTLCLKERPFGLSGPEGNHGEDVKEYWWYRRQHPHPLLDAHVDISIPPGLSRTTTCATTNAARTPRRPGVRARRHRRLRRVTATST